MEKPIEILYSDRHLVVVNKPPGLDVHGRGAEDPTSLIAHIAQQLGIPPRRLHPASRLDRPVSGVVPIAKSKLGRRSLTRQYQGREVSRQYIALVSGVPTPSHGVWKVPIGVDRVDPRRRRINGHDQQPAETVYRVRWTSDEPWSLVEMRPRTGRTHQLRVHLSQVAHCPIAGDRRYGGATTIVLADGAVLDVPRVMLHAERLTLKHPESGLSMTFDAAIWPDLEKLLTELKKV